MLSVGTISAIWP